jgi:hypothetical protein
MDGYFDPIICEKNIFIQKHFNVNFFSYHSTLGFPRGFPVTTGLCVGSDDG